MRKSPQLAPLKSPVRASSHQLTTTSATAALKDTWSACTPNPFGLRPIQESEDILTERANWRAKWATKEGREELEQRLFEEGFVLS